MHVGIARSLNDVFPGARFRRVPARPGFQDRPKAHELVERCGSCTDPLHTWVRPQHRVATARDPFPNESTCRAKTTINRGSQIKYP